MLQIAFTYADGRAKERERERKREGERGSARCTELAIMFHFQSALTALGA